MAEDHYKTLGVRHNASQEEINRAYRDTVRRCHPDLHPKDEQARARFQKVQTAIQVAEPVIGLAVTTGLGMSLQYLAFVNHLLGANEEATAGAPWKMPAMFTGGLGLLLGLVSCVLGLVVIAGAVQMKNLQNYRFAVTGAIVATLSCLSPWFLLGLPFGIWALVVLCDEQVRSAFWS